MTQRLSRDFFDRPTLLVAEQLLHKILVFKNFKGQIIETEAYIGPEDPACHAVKGRTARTEVMHGPPGFAYVYLIYGMYHCLNLVTETDGFPAAVLIRGLKLLSSSPVVLDGPGKLCREIGLNLSHNGTDIIQSPEFYLEDAPLTKDFRTTPRIGITRGMDRPWRFLAH